MWWRRQNQQQETTTPTSPRNRFRFVNKGHVLSAASYELPRDPEEINRQDFQHYMFRYMFRSNILSPVKNPLSILDVGSGTGLWAREVATQFPRANVVAVDIAPQPVYQGGRGPNYTFLQANVLERLPFDANIFDYVHQRVLVLGIPSDKWMNDVQELKRVTSPNGWVEMCEPCYGVGTPALETLFRWMGILSRFRNIDVGIVSHLGDFLTQAGFRNVQSHRVNMPVGDYGGRVGRWCATDVLAIFKGLRGPLIGAQITNEQEFDATYANFQREINTHRGVIPYYVAFGQKPANRIR
jgi:SAM-dependent methyltransferase